MLPRRTFLIVLLATLIRKKCQLEAKDDDSSGSQCDIRIYSNDGKHTYESQVENLNQTLLQCQMRTVIIKYFTYSQDEESGERLADFYQFYWPLLAPISNLKEFMILLFGAKGISVDFEIPSFSSAPDIFFYPEITDFRLLYNNGIEVRESSAGSLETSPFKNQQPISVVFAYGIRYHTNTCPLLFNQAYILTFSSPELIDSAVKYNILSFEPTNRTLNSVVNKLQLSGYRMRFDSTTFPVAVFGQTETVQCIGMMNSFEAGVLRQSVVTLILMAISRIRSFLHNNPNWLNEVNKRGTDSPLIIVFEEPEPRTSRHEKTNYIAWIETKGVDPFEDSSFCIFYQIELHSLNVLFYGEIIKKRANESCSCLLFWIVSNYQVLYHGRSVSCVNQVQLIKQCNFDKMAKRCPIEKVEPLEYRTIYDTVLDFEFFKYLADVWLVPVTSLFGIFANFLVIRTFRKIKRSPEYRRNKLTDKGRFMWEYTYYNSWFNLLHGFIFTCTPVVTCIELNGIFCSAFIYTSFFRPFYLFVESYFGNTFRLAANMSSTLFVLYRFGLNTEKLVRLRKVRPIKSVACIFVLSSTISVITLFVNEKFTVNNLLDVLVEYFQDDKKSVFNSGSFLKTAYLLNTFLVTTLFTLLNMGIDLRLLSLLRSQNTERRKEEAENRITKMVILNGLFSFLFRLPEMITAALLLIHTLDRWFFPICIVSESHFHSVCPMLFSISHFLLTISYLENLVLLYYFNDNFRTNFDLPFRSPLTQVQKTEVQNTRK
nr:G protein-coupled receptor [Proales similis]